jgi:hypothetical protein
MSKLQIYIFGDKESGFLDITEGTRLELEGITEAFDDQLIDGEFSLPVEIPWTANNRRKLGFAERVTNFNRRTYDWRCDVMEEGWPVISNGKFTILEKAGQYSYLRGSFSASISGTRGLFGSLIKSKKLADLELGDTITYATESRVFAQQVMDGTLPQYNYIRFVPVGIEGFFQTDRPDYDNEFLAKDTVNNIVLDGSTWTFGRPQSGDPTEVTTSGTPEHRDYRTIPFFRLKYVFKQLFETYGFKLKGAFIDDPAFDDLLLFNNYALERYTTGDADFNRFFDPKNHVPDMNLSDFLQAVLYFFNCEMKFTGPQDVTLNYKINKLNKQNFADVTAYTTDKFRSLLPGTERKDGYRIAYTWDSADQFISDRIKDLADKTFAATVETRVELTTLNIGRPLTTMDYAFVEAENMFYLVADATDTMAIKWDAYSENLDGYISGNQEEPVEIPLSTLCQYAIFDETSGLWELAGYLGCRQPGSYYTNKGNIAINKFGLRIFFGGIRDVSGVTMPNSYNHNRTAGNAVFAPYTFGSTQADSFFVSLHKQWQDMMINKEVVETSIIYNRRIDALLKKSDGVIVKGVYFLLYKKEPVIPHDIDMKVELVPL